LAKVAAAVVATFNIVAVDTDPRFKAVAAPPIFKVVALVLNKVAVAVLVVVISAPLTAKSPAIVTVPAELPMFSVVAAPPKLMLVALVLNNVKAVDGVEMIGFRKLSVPETAPTVKVVAAPPKFKVVALALNRFAVPVTVVVRLPLFAARSPIEVIVPVPVVEILPEVVIFPDAPMEVTPESAPAFTINPLIVLVLVGPEITPADVMVPESVVEILPDVEILPEAVTDVTPDRAPALIISPLIVLVAVAPEIAPDKFKVVIPLNAPALIMAPLIVFVAVGPLNAPADVTVPEPVVAMLPEVLMASPPVPGLKIVPLRLQYPLVPVAGALPEIVPVTLKLPGILTLPLPLPKLRVVAAPPMFSVVTPEFNKLNAATSLAIWFSV
jgi:hypothetical protein